MTAARNQGRIIPWMKMAGRQVGLDSLWKWLQNVVMEKIKQSFLSLVVSVCLSGSVCLCLRLCLSASLSLSVSV